MTASGKTFAVFCAGVGLMLVGYFQGYLHGKLGGVQALVKEEAEAIKARLRGAQRATGLLGPTGYFNVTVNEKPFGMHVRRGGMVVDEVFPGFPAHRLGVRRGCEIRDVANRSVSQGTWLEIFQRASVPFDLGLFCPPSSPDGQGPLSADPHAYRVMVVRKPFGMNVQVNVLPRVIDVLPGSLAERAGVTRGFVLKAVNESPVDAGNWLAVWEKATVPCTLTFDTDVPLHENNPFFTDSAGKNEKAGSARAVPYKVENDADLSDGFGDFRCTVNSLPFGMRVSAPPDGRPTVNSTVDGLPAEKEGVRAGDVLVEVAGRSVDSSTWFAAFEQAVPPFGLRFRRRGAASEAVAVAEEGVAVAEEGVVGRLQVLVSEKPFGMHVRRGSAIVDDVFAGFPAKRLGIRKGCQVREIASKEVSQGTWLEVFQKTAPPFNMSLFCPPPIVDADKPLSGDEHRYRTLVTQRPFGMNVQVNVLPRVVEVLPGSPAERAGVRRGFVLTAVNDEPVGAGNWFDVWQKAPTPSTLTFDMNVPLHEGNPFFNMTGAVGASSEPPRADETDVGEGFSDVRVKVSQLPFGMQVRSVPSDRPTVSDVVPGLPAAAEDVRAGDVLTEIAGLPVDSSTWFAAFQQAVPPFGLRLRRPHSPANATAAGTLAGGLGTSPNSMASSGKVASK